MNYGKFIAGLALLGIFAVPTLAASASTGIYPWGWTQCNAVTLRGQLEIQANIGVPYVIISWTVAPWSYENSFGCNRQYLTGMEITIIVNANGHQSVPSSSDPSASTGSITLPLYVQTCVYKYGCSDPIAYHPVYGNSVTVSITAVYNGFDHGTTQTLRITS